MHSEVLPSCQPHSTVTCHVSSHHGTTRGRPGLVSSESVSRSKTPVSIAPHQHTANAIFFSLSDQPQNRKKQILSMELLLSSGIHSSCVIRSLGGYVAGQLTRLWSCGRVSQLHNTRSSLPQALVPTAGREASCRRARQL